MAAGAFYCGPMEERAWHLRQEQKPVEAAVTGQCEGSLAISLDTVEDSQR